jgi:hypothetical protein
MLKPSCRVRAMMRGCLSQVFPRRRSRRERKARGSCTGNSSSNSGPTTRSASMFREGPIRSAVITTQAGRRGN